MQDNYLNEIKKKISDLHKGDKRQLEVIFSNEDRVIVEAPAGFGKTTTMVSRIAYLYASGQIPNPKKVLGLTFSVNAALKIKRDIAAKLPSLLSRDNNPVLLSEKMTVTNYHGFCKMVLNKYGYLLSDLLRRKVNLFLAIGEDNLSKIPEIATLLSNTELSFLRNINESIKNSVSPSYDEIYKYNLIIIQKLLPRNYITHNAVVLLVIELFQKYESIRIFYSNYYPLVIVDEIQDTNCIAYSLLQNIISENTKLLFLGDSLQRIYGFIGALPALMNNVSKLYSMKKVTLEKNYRFKNNIRMLRLDANIRLNAQNEFYDKEYEVAEVPAYWGETQEEESKKIVAKVKAILSSNASFKIALLLRKRGDSVPILEQALKDGAINYFYGMFNDEDLEYIKFHEYCQNMLIRRLGKLRYVNSHSLRKYAKEVKDSYNTADSRMAVSLNTLLDALIEKVIKDYGDLQAEEKYDYLMDIFENRQLKQAMEYVNSPVILSTIHGSKGLEWDYVFLVDLEIWEMPSSFICRDCPNKFDRSNSAKCLFPDTTNIAFREQLLDELSLFYVAVTRARKQVYFSASRCRSNHKAGKYSCFASLPGVKLVDALQYHDNDEECYK